MSSKPKATRSTRPKTAAAPPAASRTTRAATRSTPTPPLTEPLKKSSSRKPLVTRENSPDIKNAAATKLPSKTASIASILEEPDREPVRAFLRLRPQLGEDDSTQSKPYLEPISDTSVRMSDPSSSGAPSRLSTLPPSSIYTFSHIFPPNTSQSDFFTKTTLPLVKDVLEGQSGLLFAYGVTNSGKTYTIQGGSEEGSAGILPRTLDIVFNSIEGLHGDGKFRPVRLQGIELAPPSLSSSQASSSNHNRHKSSHALADMLLDISPDDPDTDPTTLKLDRNYEYTIWLSYAEVYNEKVYDLFASVDDPAPSSQGNHAPRPTSTFLNLPVPSGTSHSKPLLLTRKALPVKPCPLADSDSADSSTAGKYVAGIRQIRVTSAAEAKALLRLGQMHRQVFGTLANSQSSRSHAVVTLKVLRVHRGEKNDPTSIQTSRLTLVDLAGSERTKHTQTTGERLREAGNINKSLMVLGQCMETMRANQRAVARSLGGAGHRVDTRDVKRGLAVVPFRHSKLTELLMDYFVGEGRAVMIVNVNPYDTGYDENSHVMKFSALAREVCTTAPTAVSRAIPVAAQRQPTFGQNKTRVSDVVPHRRKVTISTGAGKALNETHLEVLEEDEEPDYVDDDDEPINPLVDALFDEIEMLRVRLFESQMHCAIIEAETREEVMEEMEDRINHLEQNFTRRLMKEMEQNEQKMDAKIDMLHKSGMLGRPIPPAAKQPEANDTELEDIEEEDEVDASLRIDDDDDESEVGEPDSPLAAKRSRNKQFIHEQSDIETAEEDTLEEESDVDEYVEAKPTRAKPAGVKGKAKPSSAAQRQGTRAVSVTGLVQQTKSMSLNSIDDFDDSAIIIPDKKTRHSPSAVSNASTEVNGTKKKKRQLSKKAVITEEEIERAATNATGQLRRSVRGAR